MSNNIRDAFEAYCKHLKSEGNEQDISSCRTALIRYTAPGWGFKVTSERMDSDAIESGLAFLKEIPAEQLVEALAVQTKVFELQGTASSVRRANRSYLRQFTDWAHQQGLTKKAIMVNGKPIYRFPRSPEAWGQSYGEVKHRKIPRKKSFKLVEAEKGEALSLELDEFKDFCLHTLGYRDSTTQKAMAHIDAFLGWLYRFKRLPLEKLELRDCTGFTKVNVKLSEFQGKEGADAYIQYAVEQVRRQEIAKDEAASYIKRIKEFLNFASPIPNTRSFYLDALLAVAKFLYREETNEEDFSDIPMIKELRLLRRKNSEQGKKTPEVIPYSLKSIPWGELIEVFDKQRHEADLVFRHRIDTRDNGERVYIHQDNRSTTAIAKSLQKFLMVGFFVVRPPDRSRTFYELEVGKTLKKGHWDGTRFTAEEKLKDLSLSCWWLHLRPEDYKTGDAYGEFWGVIPNVQFPDGKAFYDYIDLWLTKYRQTLKPKHDRFFVRAATGEPFNNNTLRDCISGAIYKFTGVRVTPKEIRKMYVTELNDRGASDAEKAAARWEMHHSLEMQTEVYDQQTKLKKAAPIHEFNQQLFNQRFGRKPD